MRKYRSFSDTGYFTPVTPPSGAGDPTFSHIWYLKDHLGNNRVLADGNGNSIGVNDYDPFGESIQVASSSGVNPFPLGGTESPYKYGGKEWNEWASTYDYEARYHSPGFHRFTMMDPLAEKYYGVSPYIYCASNPIKLFDPDGREIRVAKEYQDYFIKDLNNVFGEKTKMLSFDEMGTLQLNGKASAFTKGMTKDQKKAFRGLFKAMNDKLVTSVVYSDYYDRTINNETQSIDIVKEDGGGAYFKDDNVIVVAPSVGSFVVTLDYFIITPDKQLVFPTEVVVNNTTTTLFHEIGERNTKNIHYRGAVIDFENCVRRTIGLPVRPYDLNHTNYLYTDYK